MDKGRKTINKLVYVIILNYNGYADTINCIDSVKKSSYQRIQILVVDNGSGDDSVRKIEEAFPDLEILCTGQNLGFAGGNNAGIQRALEEGADYICILNNDAIVAEDMIELLAQNLYQNERRLIGPATMVWDTQIVHSTGLKINFYTGTARMMNYHEDYERIGKDELCCDYMEGTCLMFTKAFVEDVGMIPEVYFLYYEETEWSWIAKRKGYDVTCIPSARLWHKGSSAANKVNGMKLYFEDRNRVLFIRRNAPFFKKTFFYGYFSLQLFYRILSRQRDLRALQAVMDGYKGKIDWTIYDDKG